MVLKGWDLLFGTAVTIIMMHINLSYTLSVVFSYSCMYIIIIVLCQL